MVFVVSYLVGGYFLVAHKGVFQRIYQDSMPIFDSVNDAQVIVVLPIPRYISGKCCSDEAHITNFGTADCLDEIDRSVDLVKAATAGLISPGKNKVFNLYDTLANADPNRSVAEILADPASWADPVHLSRVNYAALAGALLNIKAEADAEASPRRRRQSAPDLRAWLPLCRRRNEALSGSRYQAGYWGKGQP